MFAHTRHHLRGWRVAELPRLEFSETLFVLACSGRKAAGAFNGDVVSVLDSLPCRLAAELKDQRVTNVSAARVDESSLLPAVERYAGSLYEVGGAAIQALMQLGADALIISGGYGIVLAREPIGMYRQVFHAAMWPNRLVQRCLSAYAAEVDAKTVVGVLSATTSYAKVFRQTAWPPEVERIYLASPGPTSGAMVKAPRAQGEALVAIARDNGVRAGWTSSDGLHREVTKIAAD